MKNSLDKALAHMAGKGNVLKGKNIEGKHMPDGGWVGKKANGSHSKFHYKDKQK